MTVERRCGNCRFFDRLGPRHKRGDCRHPMQRDKGEVAMWGGGLALMAAERRSRDTCKMHAFSHEEIASDRTLAQLEACFKAASGELSKTET